MLDTVTYRDENVIKLVIGMVSVKIDGKADTALASKFGIAGYPTVILANPDGTEIDRVYGYEPPDAFMQTINDYLADKNTLADYLRRADTAATMQLYNIIADKYTGRKMFTEAETYYRKILQNDPTNKQGYSDTALYNMGDMKVRAKQYAAAEEIYDRLRQTYPQSELFDDALFAKAYAMRRAEKFDDAIAGFKEFINQHPESELVPDAEIYVAICTNLKGAKDEAVTLYRAFLEKYPQSSDTTWVREQIEDIVNPPQENEGN